MQEVKVIVCVCRQNNRDIIPKHELIFEGLKNDEYMLDKDQYMCQELEDLFCFWKNTSSKYCGVAELNHYPNIKELTNNSNKSDITYPYIEKNLLDCVKINGIIPERIIAHVVYEKLNCSVKELYFEKEQYEKENLEIFLSIVEEEAKLYASEFCRTCDGKDWMSSFVFFMDQKNFTEYCSILFNLMTKFNEKIGSEKISKRLLNMQIILAKILLISYINIVKEDKNNQILNIGKVTFKDISEEITLTPAFPNNNIPIVLSSSDYFAPYCATFIKSLVEYSNIDSFYDIIIFTKDMEIYNRKLIQDIAIKCQNISVRFLEINRYISKYTLKTHAHFGIESYFRLLMPYIMNQYDKALYFDCDMVLMNDVADLYAIDIGNNYLGGCLDSVVIGAINHLNNNIYENYNWKEYCINVLNMNNPYLYLNSGVLIINLKRFRVDFCIEHILEFVQKKKFYLLDQDALNAICQPHIIVLDHAWNMTNDNGESKIPLIKMAPTSISDSYFMARQMPNTIHYADRFKPWKNPNEDLGNEFWRVARSTIYYEKILSRMCDEMYNEITNDLYKSSCKINLIEQPMGIKTEIMMHIKKMSTIILPYGSKRREKVRKGYYKARGWNTN